jgi:hypothetical protein
MPARAENLIPIVQKSYDLCTGLYTYVNRFPRAQRGLLGRVMIEDVLQMLVQITLANRRSDRTGALEEASARLDALRITMRLSQRLGFLSNGGYEDLSREIDEVGRMLGGWMKYEASPRAPVAAEPAPMPVAIAPAKPVPRRTGGVRYRMTSPTIEKYLRAKLANPHAIVFVTVGAFCQSFFEDAVYCGQTLHVAVRNLAAESEAEKILTCGIPKAKLEKYISLLRQAGKEVHVE